MEPTNSNFQVVFSYCSYLTYGTNGRKQIPVILVASYLAPQQVTGKAAEWQVRVPPIPAGFTGRDEEMLCTVDCLKQDVRIVSISGGPGYGKSSVAIVRSH